jgi:acyl-CoA thioesterase I
MDWLIYIFGSGIVYFVGIICILAAVALLSVGTSRWLRMVATLLTLIGLILVALSATPLPYWLYAILVALTLLWLVGERFEPAAFKAHRTRFRILLTAVWLACIAIEIPYHVVPSLTITARPPLYVIGDSVTAGMSDGEQDRWPQLLARDHKIDVVDLAQMGATCSSAMKQADGLPIDGGVLLLEIGGNDLLGSTSAEKFAHDLDQLLSKVCTLNRTVLMFELPLPPLSNEYGRAQRALAAKHGVQLIPKRFFIRVLAESGATLDSIHLAPRGHQRMAETVWQLVQPTYGR